MASTVSNGNDRSEKWHRPFPMATTVLRNGIDRFKWQRPFTKRKFASPMLIFRAWATCGIHLLYSSFLETNNFISLPPKMKEMASITRSTFSAVDFHSTDHILAAVGFCFYYSNAV